MVYYVVRPVGKGVINKVIRYFEVVCWSYCVSICIYISQRNSTWRSQEAWWELILPKNQWCQTAVALPCSQVLHVSYLSSHPVSEDFRAVWQLTSMSLGVGVFAIPLKPWQPWHVAATAIVFCWRYCFNVLGVLQGAILVVATELRNFVLWPPLGRCFCGPPCCSTLSMLQPYDFLKGQVTKGNCKPTKQLC